MHLHVPLGLLGPVAAVPAELQIECAVLPVLGLPASLGSVPGALYPGRSAQYALLTHDPLILTNSPLARIVTAPSL